MCHTLRMKVTAIAAITLDGFIGRSAGHSSMSWTSPEDKQWFKDFTKQAAVIVMGSKTFATFGRGLPGRKIYVFTSKPESVVGIDGVEAVGGDPKAFVAGLEQAGIEQLAVCGGSTIYGLFMQQQLVDELYLTVEPLLFGKGTPLFDQVLETKLALLETRKLNDNSLLLHYAIHK